jgi:hypothetical protein
MTLNYKYRLRRCTEARILQYRKPPYLKKYDICMSKNIYNLLSIHIFLQKSVFWIFKTTKTKVINKRKKHFAPAIAAKIFIHNYN